jgi:2-iminoacetate synthase
VGPHTISFPRIKDASEYDIVDKWRVSDADFTRLVAILRLAVPYTGLILTARESMEIRQEIMSFGVSQIDGGTKIEMGTYSKEDQAQDLDKEQFKISDNRSLGEVIDELLDKDYIPSFCTACYRTGRTGEHFMEFSVPGFIKKFCTPNAMLTLAEYMEDYAKPEVKAKGEKVIEKNLAEMEEGKVKQQLLERLNKVRAGERDLYF